MRLKTCAMANIVTLSPWQQQSSAQGTAYLNCFNGYDQPALKHALENCAAKAVSLLDTAIDDDSLYLLFEWNPLAAELQVVVTDATKQRDSAHTIQAQFPDLRAQLHPAESGNSASIDALNETVKFLLSDFLASYSPFFSYSLVAIFHSSSRAETQLL